MSELKVPPYGSATTRSWRANQRQQEASCLLPVQPSIDLGLGLSFTLHQPVDIAEGWRVRNEVEGSVLLDFAGGSQ